MTLRNQGCGGGGYRGGGGCGGRAPPGGVVAQAVAVAVLRLGPFTSICTILDVVKKKSPGSILTKKEKDAVKKKSPDSVLTNEEMDALTRKSRDSTQTEKEMDALAGAQEKPYCYYYERGLKVARDMKRNLEKCLFEDPDYFSKLTGLDAVKYKIAQFEVELEEREQRAEEERKSQQFLLTQK